MGRARNKRLQAQAGAGARTKSVDSFANFEARVGIGSGNQASAGHYQFDFISRNRIQMEAAYRSSWIVGNAVDVPAEDMTRAGITIQSTMEPDKIESIQSAMVRLGVWNSLCDTIKWARLYGGCIAVMLIDGQKSETPLNLNSIGKGQFKGLLVLDRWVVQPSLEDLVTDLGPDMGKPKYYTVVADAQGLVNQKIHYSRVIRIDGVELPYWQRIAENGWGQSVLERLWDRLLAFDSTTEGAAQLVYKAHLRTYAVDSLREIIATGGKALEGLIKQIEMIRRYQSNEGITMIDTKDTFATHQYSFSGLSDMLIQFGQQLSGALQIPLVRLFGQSPAGLNATGDSDIRNYYDHINQQQERRLRTPLDTVLKVMCLSELGEEQPEGTAFEFNPLWQMSDAEKADINQKITSSVVEAEGSGIITRKTALSEMRQASRITGVWTNITDEDIAEAENDPPAPSELLMENHGENDRQKDQSQPDPSAQS